MRRSLGIVLAVFVLVLGAALPGEAHWRGGVWIGPVWGPGWWGPAYSYPYPYYSAPPVVIQQQPQEYVYQSRPQTGEQQYWYYCAESKAYYPYVKRCPSGWMKVIPTPQAGPPEEKE